MPFILWNSQLKIKSGGKKWHVNTFVDPFKIYIFIFFKLQKVSALLRMLWTLNVFNGQFGQAVHRFFESQHCKMKWQQSNFINANFNGCKNDGVCSSVPKQVFWTAYNFTLLMMASQFTIEYYIFHFLLYHGDTTFCNGDLDTVLIDCYVLF